MLWQALSCRHEPAQALSARMRRLLMQKPVLSGLLSADRVWADIGHCRCSEPGSATFDSLLQHATAGVPCSLALLISASLHSAPGPCGLARLEPAYFCHLDPAVVAHAPEPDL